LLLVPFAALAASETPVASVPSVAFSLLLLLRRLLLRLCGLAGPLLLLLFLLLLKRERGGKRRNLGDEKEEEFIGLGVPSCFFVFFRKRRDMG